MTNGITTIPLNRFPGASLASATVKAAPATPAAAAAPAAPGVVQPGLVKAGGFTPQGENAGGLILELGKLDWSFFLGGILGIRPIFVIGIGNLGWYTKPVVGESFFMDFRDGWISFPTI